MRVKVSSTKNTKVVDNLRAMCYAVGMEGVPMQGSMNARRMAYVAMCVVLMAICSWITIPATVPFTLQTFAVALCGYSLGCAKGTAATFVYVALGAVGLPVFSGMKGGFSVLVGPTGGYIYGFVGMAALCGLGAYLFLRLTKRKGAVMKALGTAAAVVCGLAGLAVCHVCGTIQFAALTGRTFGEAAMLASVPYLAKDVISVVGAFAIGSVISMRVVNK